MLKFIGIGDLANAEMGNTSAYIKKDGTLLLLDCGTTAFARMQQLNLFDDVKRVFVAITHNHPDHIGGLASTIFYLNYWKNIRPFVILPCDENSNQKQNIQNILKLQGADEEDNYNFVYDDQVGIFKDMTSFRYVEIEHTSSLQSYAIEMKFSKNSVYYLGDNNDKKYLKSVLKQLGDEDFVYTDCTSIKLKNQVHMHLDTLNEIVDEKSRSKICCMHFANEEDMQNIKQAGFSIAKKEQSKEEYLKMIKAH